MGVKFKDIDFETTCAHTSGDAKVSQEILYRIFKPGDRVETGLSSEQTKQYLEMAVGYLEKRYSGYDFRMSYLEWDNDRKFIIARGSYEKSEMTEEEIYDGHIKLVSVAFKKDDPDVLESDAHILDDFWLGGVCLDDQREFLRRYFSVGPTTMNAFKLDVETDELSLSAWLPSSWPADTSFVDGFVFLRDKMSATVKVTGNAVIYIPFINDEEYEQEIDDYQYTRIKYNEYLNDFKNSQLELALQSPTSGTLFAEALSFDEWLITNDSPKFVGRVDKKDKRVSGFFSPIGETAERLISGYYGQFHMMTNEIACKLSRMGFSFLVDVAFGGDTFSVHDSKLSARITGYFGKHLNIKYSNWDARDADSLKEQTAVLTKELNGWYFSKDDSNKSLNLMNTLINRECTKIKQSKKMVQELMNLRRELTGTDNPGME